MEVAIIEMPVHILEGLRRENLLDKESYTAIGVYELSSSNRTEAVKILTEIKLLDEEVKALYGKKNTLFKKLEKLNQ